MAYSSEIAMSLRSAEMGTFVSYPRLSTVPKLRSAPERQALKRHLANVLYRRLHLGKYDTEHESLGIPV
jgi:hypothetical protein